MEALRTLRNTKPTNTSVFLSLICASVVKQNSSAKKAGRRVINKTQKF
jgi:hypothetical protein